MGPVLCLDIGSGTQDVLYWTPDRAIENCPKFVLPSPAKLVAARIRELTAKGLPIHLCGHNMGGGFGGAVRGHAGAGLAVSAHPEAALALSDDPVSLKAKGISLALTCPPGHVPVHLADYDPGFWRALLATCGLEEPHLVLACAQDHGHHPGQSSRTGRFALWERFLATTSGRLEDLFFTTPPPELTRLAALSRSTGGGPVMDSGPAAALGALTEPAAKARADESGALIVNMGNSHVLGLLVKRGALLGVYEHHTGMLPPEILADQLDRFRSGGLHPGEAFETGGHGSLVTGKPEGFADVFAIGPRRAELTGLDAAFPAPGGDMMLTGCFGLLEAWRMRAAAS